jgi:hypothetical protein
MIPTAPKGIIYKTGKGLRFILPRTTCCTINQNNTLVEDL